MTPQQFQRRSLELTPAQWAALEALAAPDATDSLAPTGPNAGKASWRSLIKRIAIGEIGLVDPSRSYIEGSPNPPIYATDY